MNDLNVFEHDHVNVVDSRQVAEMVEKNHKDLLRDIRTYIEILGKSGERNFAPSDFFIQSTYTNTQNKKQPCYLLTKKGCDMVANKMTGEKGVLFTAAYVTAFEAMREHITQSKPMTDYQRMIAETRRKNSRLQSARLLTQMAKQYSGTSYEQVLNAYATKELTGDFLLPLPELTEKTYSAEEIGSILGISKNKVGALANKNGMKTDRYGKWFKDKSPYCSKEVSTFRYFESAIPVFRELISDCGVK